MDNYIFDKTDKGREEIITRKYRLASRLRSLLVLIDGKKSNAELLSQIGGLGLDMQSLAELAEGEFIESVAVTPGGGAISQRKETQAKETHALTPDRSGRAPASGTPSVIEEDNLSISDNDQSKVMISPEAFLALQTFFNETIRNMIGLRGFTLQLKVERASSLGDFQALREPYLVAIKKAKGQEMMNSLAGRLDQLLLDAERSR